MKDCIGDNAAKPAVAVSACLLGECCTWRGDSNALPASVLVRLGDACEIVPVCPEVQGGLPTPRQPSEIVARGNGSCVAGFQGKVAAVSDIGIDHLGVARDNARVRLVRGFGDGGANAEKDNCAAFGPIKRVVSKTGEDVTAQFEAGAAAALADAQAAGCRFALLKEKSPSCGYGRIYDGTFSGRLVPGNGVAAQAFSDAGIKVFGESRVGELLVALGRGV